MGTSTSSRCWAPGRSARRSAAGTGDATRRRANADPRLARHQPHRPLRLRARGRRGNRTGRSRILPPLLVTARRGHHGGARRLMTIALGDSKRPATTAGTGRFSTAKARAGTTASTIARAISFALQALLDRMVSRRPAIEFLSQAEGQTRYADRSVAQRPVDPTPPTRPPSSTVTTSQCDRASSIRPRSTGLAPPRVDDRDLDAVVGKARAAMSSAVDASAPTPDTMSTSPPCAQHVHAADAGDRGDVGTD